MYATLLALLIQHPILELPQPLRVTMVFSDEGRRVDLTVPGEIPDPVRVFAPRALQLFINGEKMSCYKQGGYRLLGLPILHNQEACEPKQ